MVKEAEAQDVNPADLNGPGKYEFEASFVHTLTGGDGVAVIVLGGNRGPGFAVHGTARFVTALPDLLEDVARRMREQRRRVGH